MANSVIGALRVMLGMDTAEFEDGATRAERAGNRLHRDLQKTAGNLQKTGQTLTLALTAPLVAFGVSSIQAAKESQDALGQVNAALASMGDQAGRTSEQLQELAARQMSQSLFDDDQILREVTANLLTFGRVAGEEFDRAQQAALDLSTRLGTDLSSATVQIGKALNDPIKGVAALGKAGIQFSEDQKAMIKSLVETGDVAGAQRIILGELEKQFGGAAKAAREADPGAALAQSFANFQEEVGAKLLPLLPPLLDAITGIIDAFSALPEPVQTGVIAFAGIAAVLGPVIMGIGAIIGAVSSFVAAVGGMPMIVSMLGLAFNAILVPLAPIAAGVAAVVAAWYYWDEIVALVGAVGDAVSGWWSETVSPTLDSVGAALVDGARNWYDFHVAVAGELAKIGGAARDWLGARLSEVFAGVKRGLGVIAQFLSGDFSGAWRSLQSLAVDTVRNVASAIDGLFPGLIEMGRDIIRGIVEGIRAAPGAVRDALLKVVQAGVDSVKDFLGIRSPSLLFFEVGSNIVQGLANGITDGGSLVHEAMQKLGEDAEVQTVRVAETFAQMAQNISGSLRQLTEGIKSGDFFDIFDAVLNVVTTLGGAGLFGSGFRDRINAVPGFAQGGAMTLGGFAGIDRNVLSLNGSPIARVSRGETMEIRNGQRSGGGGTTVVNNYYTLPSDEFWGRVDGRAAAAAVPVARQVTGQAFQQFGRAREQALA
jgi:hypothetical protein